ncbi:hypothetical protein ACVW0P_002858 [Mucilaginibacter sp. UYNi724]
MLDSYFDQAVQTLKAWDNSAHTDKEYTMTMLFGLDNGTDLLPMQGSLKDEYNKIMLRKGITQSDLDKFWPTQLKSTNNKLPAGCQ